MNRQVPGGAGPGGQGGNGGGSPARGLQAFLSRKIAARSRTARSRKIPPTTDFIHVSGCFSSCCSNASPALSVMSLLQFKIFSPCAGCAGPNIPGPRGIRFPCRADRTQSCIHIYRFGASNLTPAASLFLIFPLFFGEKNALPGGLPPHIHITGRCP